MSVLSILSRLGRAFGQGQPIEQKSISLNSPEAFGLFGVQPVASGVSVTAASAMRVPAVCRAVSLIAESVATLPFKIYRQASREAAKDHPAYALVHDHANDWTSAEAFREPLTVDALLHGDGFAQVARNSEGKPIFLLRVPPGAVSIEHDDIGEPSYRIRLKGGGDQVLPFTDVLHVQALGGVSPVTLAKEAIGLAVAAEQHLANFYQKGGRPGVVIKHEKFIEEDTKRKILQQWHATHGERNAGGIGFLDENMQLEIVSSSHTDAQFLENRLEQIREIARAFGVPPAILFELSRGTWSNFEQSQREFLTGTLRPWIARWQAAYSRVLLTPEERARLYIEATADDMLSVDHAARATAFSQYVSMRAMTPNEVRARMNMPPMEGGDVLQNPFTTSGASPAPANPQQDNDA